jgi:hypothetical protein
VKARDRGAEIFTASVATTRPDVTELRELNRRRDRLIRNLRRIYQLGPGATGELAIELATRVDGLLVLEELARRFADRLDPDLLRAIGCHYFPCPPLHVVGGSRR